MKTVILKWNPAVSSYQMLRYLQDLNEMATEQIAYDSDWSVWENEKIHAGDRFYLIKLGVGQVGIVSSGVITSEPYLAPDWRKTDKKVYYVDYLPNIVINPDTLPILTSEALAKAIPDFDWFKGHSGMVLEDKQAEALEKLWKSYLATNKELFDIALADNKTDQLYLDLNFEKATFNELKEGLTEKNTMTINVNKYEYLDAFFRREFSIILNNDNYQQIIEHVDGNPVIKAPNQPKRNYGINWYNRGVFPYQLRKGVKYIKLVYGNQYMVARFNREEMGYSITSRFSKIANNVRHICKNGACCDWQIEFWYVDILVKDFNENVLPKNK